MADYEKIMQRLEAAKANKSKWEHQLRECHRYFMPERNTFDKGENGQKIRDYVFDSTAQDSLEDFAMRMESELIPSNTNWMKLEAGTDIPDEDAEKAERYLDETTEIVFNHIRSSNFAAQAHEAFLDLGISTGALIVEAGDGIQSALNFRCVSLGELILEQSQRGIVTTVYREFKLPVNDILSIYPRAKLNDKLQQILNDKPTTEVELIEATIDDNKGMFDNVVIYKENKHFLIDEKIESSPWIVFRETTMPGETYGRGRAMIALADTKTLNLMVKDHLKAAAFAANPMFTAADDGIINPHNIKLKPGIVLPVGSNDNSNPTLRPLEVRADYNILQYDMQRLQENIRRIMISKPFGDVQNAPVRTATEMSIRNADAAKVSLGASSRIQNELLEALVKRCVYVLKKAGKIAPFEVDGKEVAIKFTSPSARMQDEQQLAAMGRFMEMMVALPPELVNEEIRIEDFPSEVIDILGLPNRFKRSQDEKDERANQRQQQEMQEQQMAIASVERQNGGQ